MAAVAGKQRRPQKHVPQRTCVGCRSVTDKRALIRLVRTSDGVWVDKTGKLAGRGAYLHERRSCWERGLKGPLEGALKVSLGAEDIARLRDFMNALPEERSEQEGGA